MTVGIAFPERTVTRVTYRVPPGPSGKMGWALTSAGAPVIPIQRGSYIVTDNQADTWDLAGYLDSGNWAVTGYNTGNYDHTVYLTFSLDLPGAVPSVAPSPLPVGVGVVGSTGSVTPPPPSGPPSTVSPPPSDDTVTAVTTVILGALLARVQGAAG